MGREREGYRDTLSLLLQEHSMLISKKEASKILGISFNSLAKLIARGKISCDGGKVLICSIARYLCG